MQNAQGCKLLTLPHVPAPHLRRAIHQQCRLQLLHAAQRSAASGRAAARKAHGRGRHRAQQANGLKQLQPILCRGNGNISLSGKKSRPAVSGQRCVSISMHTAGIPGADIKNQALLFNEMWRGSHLSPNTRCVRYLATSTTSLVGLGATNRARLVANTRPPGPSARSHARLSLAGGGVPARGRHASNVPRTVRPSRP